METVPTPVATPTPAWEARYRAPIILWTAIAPGAPARGLAITNRSGTQQLYAWDVPTGALRALTDRPAGILFADLSPAGRDVFYLDDHQGDELGHWVRVPWEGGPSEDLSPGAPRYSSFAFRVSRSGNRAGFVRAGDDGFATEIRDRAPDGTLTAPRIIHTSRKSVGGLLLAAGGEWAVIATPLHSDALHYTLLAVPLAGNGAPRELWDGQDTSVVPVAFAPTPGDPRVLAMTNRSGRNLPLVWDVGTGERTDLAVGDRPGDVAPLGWWPDGGAVLLCRTHQAVQELLRYDLATHTATPLAAPAGSYSGAYVTPAGEIFTGWQDATHPARVIALDGATGALRRTVLAAGEAPPSRSWRSITFPATGGTPIQGWLAVPDGPGPFPLILHTHGGPQSVQREAFVPGCQAWLDHGFAWCSINYHGSTTFGRAFEEAIWGHLGDYEVVDLVAARAWLIAQGVARPGAIFLTGASYGGYLTQHTLGRVPDGWAGGMAQVAVADWAIEYEDESPALQGLDRGLFGGTPAEKPDAYRAASPLTYAERVAAPILVIQGRNDTRCPARQMEIYEARLRGLGKPIEVIWFDAGHGSLRVEEQIAHQARMLAFAQAILAGK